MKFSCDKALLQAACNTAARAAASKSPIPALEGLQLSAEDRLYVKGYDLKKAIVTAVDADIAQRGTLVVGAISSADYPELPSFDAQNNVALPQSILKDMINRTLFAVSTDEVRPIYTGTLFEIEGDELTLVSVDGYRLARRSEKLEKAEMENCSFVVPGSALSDVEKICADEEEPISIAVGAKHISFTVGDATVISRRLEGEFLNYRRSIPDTFRSELKVDRNELMSVIDRVSLIVSEKNTSPVRMTLGDGVIDCLCVTPIGRAEDVCTCEGNGNELVIGFNDRYMKDALKAAPADELKLCVNTASSPCILKAADGSEGFTFMVLPVRLHA